MKRFFLITPILLLILVLLLGCAARKTPGSASPSGSLQMQQSPSPGGLSATPGPSGTQEGVLAVIPSVKPKSKEAPASPDPKKTAGIPEAQPFVNYSSAAGHYDVQAPEGWTAEATGQNIKFTHNYNGVKVEIVKSTEAFSLKSITEKQVAEFIRTGRAVTIKSISLVDTNSGPAVLVEYESNSEPDSSGRKMRIAGMRYYFKGDGKLAVLTLWGPVEADNDNIWKQIPDTFVWRS
jgi:hypothetical protein